MKGNIMKEETAKEVFENWRDTMDNLCTVTWKGICEIFSSSFDLIKEPMVVLAKALYEWVIVVGKNLAEILKSFVLDLVCKTCTSIWKFVRITYRLVKAKIMKGKK